MSKQLTGALFVDIQGDNKNLKKSLNDSKQSVAGFGAAVTQIVGSNPALAALMGGLGAFAGMKGQFQKKMGFQGMKRAGTMARNRRSLAQMSHRNITGFMGGDADEDGTPLPTPTRGQAFIARQRLTRARTDAAKEKLASRGRRGGFLGRTSTLGNLKSASGMKAAAGIAMKAGGAFLMSGAGLLLLGGIAASIMGTLVGSALKRGAEGRKYDVSRIREDALTKVARIKQNMQIAKSTYGQGFRGGAERYYDRQAAGLAPAFETGANVVSGSFWSIMGVLAWNMRGGIGGGIGRWAMGGDFF